MKFKRTLSALLAAATLAACLSFTTAAAPTEFVREAGEVILPSLGDGDFPEIDGILEPESEKVSASQHFDKTSMTPFWSSLSKCLITMDVNYSVNSEGLYIGGTVKDPTFTPSTGPDFTNGTGNPKFDDYGGDGDVLAFAIDPLGKVADYGNDPSVQEWNITTPWYNIVPMENGEVKIYRTRYNGEELTEQVECEAAYELDGWTFECVIPWSIIIADTFGITNGNVSLSVDDLTAIDASLRGMFIYMDRAVFENDSEYNIYSNVEHEYGTVFTIGRNHSISTYLPDGTTSAVYSSGTAAKVYGIRMSVKESREMRVTDFGYLSINNGTEYALLSYSGTSQSIKIPGTINGIPITTIKAGAFENLNGASVYLTSDVKTIDDEAFVNCQSLKIYTTPGSAAAEFAGENGINTEAICDNHVTGGSLMAQTAACEIIGLRVLNCTTCGAWVNAFTIPALEHQLGDWKITIKATCKDIGRRVKICSVCNKIVISQKYILDEHQYGLWLYSEAPLCKGGYKMRICSVCQKTERESLSTLGCVSGNWEIILDSTENDTGVMIKRCIYCGMVLSTWLTGTTGSPKVPFSDVSNTDWYFNAVSFVLEEGYMNGVGNNLFSPNTSITRGMFAMLLANMSGDDLSIYSDAAPFSDTEKGVWYSPAIAWAKDTGIISGNEDGTFAPNNEISRQQMAAMMYNFATYKGIDTSVNGNPLSAFSDSGEIHDYARNACAWAVNWGIINGLSSDTFAPSMTATRAQAAQIITNYFSTVA